MSCVIQFVHEREKFRFTKTESTRGRKEALNKGGLHIPLKLKSAHPLKRKKKKQKKNKKLRIVIF